MSNLPTERKIYFIIGPTGTGKSDLAVYLALQLQKNFGQKCEIISAHTRLKIERRKAWEFKSPLRHSKVYES
jgi:shikimate kinase